jgi:glycosyltransferase involved in cell wall biosynthesis
MNDLISIVLPVYNGEQYLRESIESVIGQTYGNWELLILDDCSTDATQIIALDYASKDRRIRYYKNDTNLRLPRNLNKGFSIARGEWLTWTSDDNYYYPTALEKMLSVAKKFGREYVIASSIVINSEGEKTEDWTVPIDAYERSIGECVGNACFLYSRNVYEKTGDYNPEAILCEDFDYWQRICMKFQPAIITEPLYAYRKHASSLTSTLNHTEICNNIKTMLGRNVSGYGKLNYRQKYYYYKELARCNRILEEKDYKISIYEKYYHFLYLLIYDLPKRIVRKLK